MINKFLSVVAVAGTALWGSAANADLFLATSLNGAAFVQQATSANNDVASFGPIQVGNFLITNVNATGSALLPFPEILLSNTLTVETGAGTGTLDIRITETDLTLAPQLATFVSSATINLITNATIVMSTFWDPANGNPATSPLSSTAVLSTIGTFGPDFQNRNVGAGAFSVTELFHIVSSGPGSVQATIRLAVPGPVVGAGLPGLITACFGLLALARRRRQQRTAIA